MGKKQEMGKVDKIDFSTFIYSLGTAALISTGDIPDPKSGKLDVNLEDARQNIDILEIIKDKTKGNLTEDEDKVLQAILHEVKSKYIVAVKKEVIEG